VFGFIAHEKVTRLLANPRRALPVPETSALLAPALTDTLFTLRPRKPWRHKWLLTTDRQAAASEGVGAAPRMAGSEINAAPAKNDKSSAFISHLYRSTLHLFRHARAEVPNSRTISVSLF
jgi:hypothetical protein